MTNADYFLKEGNEGIDYFVDKWIDSDMNLLDFLRSEYKREWNNE